MFVVVVVFLQWKKSGESQKKNMQTQGEHALHKSHSEQTMAQAQDRTGNPGVMRFQNSLLAILVDTIFISHFQFTFIHLANIFTQRDTQVIQSKHNANQFCMCYSM